MALMLKAGVKLADLCPQMVLATQIIAEVYAAYGVDCVVTSANDSEHMEGSKHGTGEALDYRTRDLTSEQQVNLTNTIIASLGQEFDVVLESDHLHVEYDVPAETAIA